MGQTASPLLTAEEVVSGASAGAAAAPAIDLGAGAWAAFTTASTEADFCRSWLALQCAMVAGARCGLLLLRDPAGQAFAPAAVWPDPARDLTYLSGAAERALAENRGIVFTVGDSERVEVGTAHVAYPVSADAAVLGVVVLDLSAPDSRNLQSVLRQLIWGAGWLEVLLRRRQGGQQKQVLERAAIGLDIAQAAQEQQRLDEAAMAVVNELATHLKGSRVCLGLERAGKLELRAISRTAWFDRKSQLVESIENAMEEAMDQEAPVAYPAAAEARGRIIVAQRDLSLRTGAAAVLTVPLRGHGKPVGAITIERDEGPAFDEQQVLLCELIGELVGPALHARLRHERWVAGRAVETLARWRDILIGERRPLAKLGALAALVAVVFLATAQGEFRVSAKTAIEGQVQRGALAPFEGFIAAASVRAGDTVRKGQLLAALDDRDLRLERTRWESEYEQAISKHREALAKHDRAATRTLAAQVNQAAAQLALVEERLLRTQVVAPFDGLVISGDLSQRLGAPVEKGAVLFELAPLDQYRVVLQVDDRDVAHVAAGQRGELALTGLTGVTLPFTVKAITPVSVQEEGRNYFRVEAGLDDASARLRPGMEGVGKIAVGERKLVWIWTRNFVNWLRIFTWSWMP